jgi:hypothetical protein
LPRNAKQCQAMLSFAKARCQGLVTTFRKIILGAETILARATIMCSFIETQVQIGKLLKMEAKLGKSKNRK